MTACLCKVAASTISIYVPDEGSTDDVCFVFGMRKLESQCRLLDNGLHV